MTSSFFSQGKKVEYLFTDILQSFGTTQEATKDQDIHEHWDVSLTTLFDVKGLRKVKRNDDDYNENIQWIELRNVHGNKGWIHGKAHIIAFETIDYWILVERKRLLTFINRKVQDKQTLHTEPQLYKLYRRSGREDVLTMIKTLDLCSISFAILDKKQEEEKLKESENIEKLL
jgi:hypothetical protein